MRIFSVRLAAALLLSLSLAACQASGTAGSSRGANASVFTNILTRSFKPPLKIKQPAKV